MKEPDWYALLGVGRAASGAQIARAFRKAAFRWHPDRNASNPDLAHQQFLLVHQAYEVLSNPVKRTVYDAKRSPHAVAFATEPDPPRRPRRPPRPRAAAPLAFEPPPKPPAAGAFASRASWFVLSLLIRAVGFLAMLVLGPFAERRTKDDLHRRAPAFVEMVFPMGRIALLAAVILAILWAWQPEAVSPKPAIVLAAIGGIVLVIERVALASVWAIGRGRTPRE